MDTLGIVNGTPLPPFISYPPPPPSLSPLASLHYSPFLPGCIDDLYQHAAYTEFTYNNTYSIQAINATEYARQTHELHRPGGLLSLIRTCQAAARALDPNEHGDVSAVIKLCQAAKDFGENLSMEPYSASRKYGAYDITHPAADAFPSNYWVGYLNRGWVQKALGVPVNHTSQSMGVNRAFEGTGDFMRGGLVEDIAYVLDRGVKVALMYGDRDWYVDTNIPVRLN